MPPQRGAEADQLPASSRQRTQRAAVHGDRVSRSKGPPPRRSNERGQRRLAGKIGDARAAQRIAWEQPVDPDLASCGLEAADQGPEQGRLPRPVAAEHAEAVTGGDIKRHVGEDQATAISERQISHRQDNRHCAASRRMSIRWTQTSASAIPTTDSSSATAKTPALLATLPPTRPTGKITSCTLSGQMTPPALIKDTSRSHPMAPENRGRPTLAAHGSVDAMKNAIAVPDSSSGLCPPCDKERTLARIAQLHSPGTSATSHCAIAMRTRDSPRAISRSK